MKIGIMQPYFVPYIGYWQLMNAVDKYVIYDDVNYINRGWINRNRILVNDMPCYFNIPMLGASQNKKINEIEVNKDERLQKKNLNTIKLAYTRAPYFKEVYPLLEKIFQSDKTILSEFIQDSFLTIGKYLNITTEFIVSSSINKDNSQKGQEKILTICELLGATEYYNAIGGQELYSKERFWEKNINLSFLKTNPIVYKQYGEKFQENLSIIDVMMFNSQREVINMLDQYTVI